MDLLKVLIKGVSRRKLRFAKMIGEKKDLADQLYFMIHKNPQITDEEVLNQLFSGPHKQTYLRRVKKILRDRILTTILSLPPEDDQPFRSKAYHRCQKALAAAHILRMRGKLDQASAICKEHIRESMRYHLTDLTVEFALILRHSSALGNDVQYEKWTNCYLKNSDLQRRERHTQNLYLEVLNSITASKVPDETVVRKAEVYSKHVLAVVDEGETSYSLIMYAYNTLYLCAQCKGSTEEMISACLRAHEKFGELSFEIPPLARFSFSYKALYLSIEQERYQNVENLILQAKKDADRQRNKWVTNWLEAIYQLRMENLKSVIPIIDDLDKLSFTDQEKEEVILLKGYSNFLLLVHQQKTHWEIDLASYRSDKTGNYATSLIISFLTDLVLSNHDELVDRTEAFMQYAYRHLNKKPLKDKFHLFKALVTIPNNGFNKSVAMEEGQKFIEKIGPPGVQIGLEVIPLKKIWDYAISTL